MELPCSKSERAEKEEKKIFGQGVHYCRWVGRKMTDVERWMKSEYWHPLNCPWHQETPLKLSLDPKRQLQVDALSALCGSMSLRVQKRDNPVKDYKLLLQTSQFKCFTAFFKFSIILSCAALKLSRKFFSLMGHFWWSIFLKKYLTFDHHRAHSE